jgi:hypothetical protein
MGDPVILARLGGLERSGGGRARPPRAIERDADLKTVWTANP